MHSDHTPDADPEQLLKLLESQVAVARTRRAARESSRGRAGTIGLSIIVGGAAIALWMLLLLLEQMRPQQSAPRENGSAAASELAR